MAQCFHYIEPTDIEAFARLMAVVCQGRSYI
jgi:hypothetical protein